jgi:hypothetical protein
MSRSKATAPPGRVTMEQAAELAGVSKSAVQRRIADGTVPARTEPDGVVTIARGDVKLIEPREPADDTRKAVMVRVPLDRYKLWARAAKARRIPVSTWLAELADQAVDR